MVYTFYPRAFTPNYHTHPHTYTQCDVTFLNIVLSHFIPPTHSMKCQGRKKKKKKKKTSLNK